MKSFVSPRFLGQLLSVGFLVLVSCNQNTEKVTQVPAKNVPDLQYAGLGDLGMSKVEAAPQRVRAIDLTPSKIVEISKTSKRIPLDEMLKTSVTFTENKGQLERFESFNYPEIGEVKFYSKAFCGNAYFGNKGIGYAFQRVGLRDADFAVNGTPKEKLTKSEKREITGFELQFVGANTEALIEGQEQQHTKFNFLKGNSPAAFVTDVASYQKVRYHDLYKGVDLVYYSKNNQLKYDYVVAPKSDVSQIKMRYSHVQKLQLSKKGELEILINWGTLVDETPYCYQIVNGKKKEVKVEYTLLDSMTVGFHVKGKYDPTKELVIDPYTIAWATYIGTATSDDGYLESTCMDNTGRTYGTGWTNNAFPINASANGYDKTSDGTVEAFVFRINVAGTALDYVTYLGGSGYDVGTAIVLSSTGEICVTGHTSSYLSMTPKDMATSNTLTVSTGSKTVNVPAIASYGMGASLAIVSGANVLYGVITGFPSGTQLTVNVTSVSGSGTFNTWDIYQVNNLPFPTTAGAIQTTKTGSDGNEDIFFVKLNGSGNNLIYGTYYGGTASNSDWALDMVLDASNNAYITGRTQTTSGFSTAGVYKTTAQGGYDSYVLKINSANTLGYCTYVGGAGNDIAKGIVVNSAGEVFVAGLTNSSGQATGSAVDQVFNGGMDGFVLKLTSTGTIGWYTYVGGSSDDGACGIDIAPTSGDVVVVGTTVSSDFPMMNAFDNSLGGRDAFLTRILANGTNWVYSTYLGGDGMDNGKGWDFTTIHKNGGVKLSTGELPVVVYGNASTAASMSSYLISPITYTAVNQSGGSFSFNGGSFSGNDDWFINVFSANAQTCLFGMYMGGADNDYPTAGVNIDLSSACITLGGGVHSLPFPVTSGAFQTQRVNTTTPDQATVAKVCLNEILPVEFGYFKVNEQNGDGLLRWATASEKNNAYFEILKSTDGQHFYAIGKVDGNGNASTISEYSFVDTELTSGVTYYKLKQVDVDGNYRFSDVRSLTITAFSECVVSPNPGNGIFDLKATINADTKLVISVMSVVSHEVYHSEEIASKGAYAKSINLSNLATGVYIVQVKAGSEVHSMRYIKE